MNKFRNNLERFFVQASTLGIFGYCPYMPGTVGALWGTIFSYAIFFLLRGPVVCCVSFFLILFGILSCGIAEKFFEEHDPKIVILDEFVAMPICFFPVLVNSSYIKIWTFFLGFLIFRLFDILKPFGIKKLEKLPGGVGIVCDDLGAAAYTGIVLYLILLIC